MERHLTKLLTNNDPPSEATMHEVKELLVNPLQELEEINVEITNLEVRVKSLKEKRDTIQNSINKYRTILSPVRRIHTDILHEIFYHCLPNHRNPILTDSEAPVLLTRVCSTWRTIALSSPRLWAQLHIIFTDDYRNIVPPPSPHRTYLDDYDAHLRPRALRILKLRCEVMSAWLMRSGTCPLSISINYSSVAWTLEDMEPLDDSDLTMELFKTLLQFSHRWRSLELAMPIEIYHKLDAMISNSPHTLPLLTGLKLSFHEQIPQSPGIVTIRQPITLLNAPRLNSVSLSGPSAESGLWAFGATPYAEWVSKLTYLSCHIVFTVEDGFNLLKQCGNLIHCKLLILPDYRELVNPPFQNTDDIIWSHSVASLPHLISLSIMDDSANHGWMVHFYSSLDAPRLKWIDYQQQLSYYPNDITNGTAISCPIFSLLQKSSELKKFNIDPRSFSSVNLHRALEIVSPTLTHLVLGQESLLGSSRPLAMHRSFNPVIVSSTPFDLEWLVVKQDFEVGSSSGLPRRNILLPHLEILESSQGVASDDTLLQFITTRMDPYSSDVVAVLKRVRIIFDRLKEVDVVEEVARYRDKKMATSGAWLDEVKLDLDYLLDPLNKPIDPLSSSYGLGKDDRSWNYPDINESLVPE